MREVMIMRRFPKNMKGIIVRSVWRCGDGSIKAVRGFRYHIHVRINECGGICMTTKCWCKSELVDNAKLAQSCFRKLVFVGIPYATQKHEITSTSETRAAYRVSSAIYLACTLCISSKLGFSDFSTWIGLPPRDNPERDNDGGINTYQRQQFYGGMTEVRGYLIIRYMCFAKTLFERKCGTHNWAILGRGITATWKQGLIRIYAEVHIS